VFAYCKCVCILVVVSQHAVHIFSALISFMGGPSGFTVFFYLIYYTPRVLGEKTLSNIKCVFCFSLQILSETYFFLRRIQRMLSLLYIGLHVKCPLFLADVNESWIFWTDFRKIMKYQISRRSPPPQWEPSCSCGRTDMTNILVAFLNYTNAPRNTQY
jgi:hypothetical protein